MRKEQILVAIENNIEALIKDLEKIEQGESPDDYELAYYMKGLEHGLKFTDRDEITILLSDICKYTYSPYEYLHANEGNLCAIRYFKSSIMKLYLLAQSLIKDLGNVAESEHNIEELFKQVFVGV